VVKILQILERPSAVLLVITKLLDERTGWTESRSDDLAILVRVLTLVGLVMPDDTPSSGTRSSVPGHMTGHSADNGTFDATLGICRCSCSEHCSQCE